MARGQLPEFKGYNILTQALTEEFHFADLLRDNGCWTMGVKDAVCLGVCQDVRRRRVSIHL